jgi:hypothetical protein
LLSIAKELRRMKKQEELQEFTRFEAAYGKAVWEASSQSRPEGREFDGLAPFRPFPPQKPDDLRCS